MNTKAKTQYPDDFKEMGPIPQGTIFRDWHDEGIRILIMRGPYHPCVYLGIPPGHPLANLSYDDLNLECHGGLTFAGLGDGKHRPEGYFWYGYDYGHCDDFMFSDFSSPIIGKKWTIKEIEQDAWTAICGMKSLMRLAEKIKAEAA